MQIEFANEGLRRLYEGKHRREEYSQEVAGLYRRRVDFLMAAGDERDLLAWKTLACQGIEGSGRARSIRIDERWEIIIERVEDRIRVIAIKDSIECQQGAEHD